MNNAAGPVQKPLGLRLLKRVLAVSLTLILLLAGGRAWWEYRSALAAVEEEFTVIEGATTQTVAASLWIFDKAQLDLHVEAARKFRHISYAAVLDRGKTLSEAGVRRDKGVLSREYPIYVAHNGQRVDLGVLLVQADLAAAMDHAFRTALLGLGFSSALVLLVAGLTFLLTSTMVSRHLSALADHFQSYRLTGEHSPLRLDRRRAGDELDVLADAVNAMQEGLAASLAQLLAAQAEVRSLARFPQENPNPVLRAGADGVIIKANPAWESLFGAPAGQRLPEDFTAAVSRALSSGQMEQLETSRNGAVFAFNVTPVVAEGFANLYGMDITRRVQAEKAARDSEARLALAAEGGGLGLWEWRADLDRATVTDYWLKLKGLSREEYDRSVNQWIDGLHPEDRGRVLTLFGQHMNGETEQFEADYRFRHPERGWYWEHASARVVERDAEGRALRMVGFHQDVSERKQAEEAMRRQVVALTQPLEKPGSVRFIDLFNLEDIQRIQDTFAQSMNVASIITTPDGVPLTRPSNFCRLCSEIIRKTEKGLANCYASDAVLGRPNPAGATIQPCLSGGLWDAGASITVGGEHVANWLIGQVRNEALDQESMLAYADEIGADREQFSAALAEVPEMSSEQFAKVAKALHLISSELSLRAYQNVQQARFIHARQEAEAQLRESEARIRALFDATSDSAILMDLSGGILAINEHGAMRRGLTPEQLFGRSIYDHLPPAAAGLRRASTREALRTNSPQAYEEEREGRHYAITLYPIADPDGVPRQLASFSRDITREKAAEEDLRRVMSRLTSLVRVLQHRAESVQEFLDFCLTEALAMTGSRIGYIYHYSEERREFVLNTWSAEVMDECAVKGAPTVYQLDKTGIWGEAVRQRKAIIVNDFHAPHPLKKGYPEGHVALTNFMTVPVFHAGRIVAVAGVANREGGYQDSDAEQFSLLMEACWQVVGRMDAERATVDERRFTDAVLDSMPGLAYLYDDQGRLVRWNKRHEDITGYSREEMAGMRLLDWYKGDEATIRRISLAIGRVMAEGMASEEADLQTKDGRRIPFFFTAVRLEIDGRTYFTGIGIDISERKRAEEEIRRSLREKEILLKEIHHRVKNNLQIISSLLYLQAEYVVEPEDRVMFAESQRRIAAMALVHEELYGSSDLSSVAMADYVPRLVDRVAATADVPVRVEYDVADLRLPITRSIPCGLVLNEMVMNAVKHAFRCQCGGEGLLRVALASQGGLMELSVEDNGPGLPEGFDLESPTTLGLTLITSLAQQLGGGIRAENLAPGARFVLRFPVEERP